jgi:hypothetical protein
MFVAKLTSDGKAILSAVYFGGSGSDGVTKLALDPAGNVYIAGTTTSTDFPTTPRSLSASYWHNPIDRPMFRP